jgi:hypothetical protein
MIKLETLSIKMSQIKRLYYARYYLLHPFICGVPLPERLVNQLHNGIRYMT